MSDVATQAQAVKDAVKEVFDAKCAEVDSRVEQLQRIKTASTEASENTTQQAIDEANDYLATLGVDV